MPPEIDPGSERLTESEVGDSGNQKRNPPTRPATKQCQTHLRMADVLHVEPVWLDPSPNGSKNDGQNGHSGNAKGT